MHIYIENDFDVSLFYSISYSFINKSVHMLYIYSHYVMKLHEFFFFLQAHEGIFFSSSISCMNFFFGSDTPPPRISNGPPLSSAKFWLFFHVTITKSKGQSNPSFLGAVHMSRLTGLTQFFRLLGGLNTQGNEN